MREAEKDSTVKDLLHDKSLMDTFRKTRKLSEYINKTEEFNWVVIPGKHGAMIDLPHDHKVQQIISQIYENNGFVAAIGHGVAALINIKDKKKNEYCVKDKRLTCYSDREEREKGFEKMLPFSVEQKLREHGARVENEKPFHENVVVEERLITGQNSQSAHMFVHKLLETYERMRN